MNAINREVDDGAIPSVFEGYLDFDGYDEMAMMYKRHLLTAERIKSNYVRIFNEMVEKLSAEHFEPFAAVLLQYENRKLLDRDDVILGFKENLREKLKVGFLKGWEGRNMTKTLADLEILKERFKEYEGKNWHAAEMSAEQRILPIDIHYKEATKRCLQKQISTQNQKLQKLLETISIQRARIQEITNRRVYLKEAMENEIKQLEEKEEMMHQFEERMLSD